MSKKTKYIGFCSSKGGVGKSSMTILTASYLHYVRGLNVAVIDCDFPIKSIKRVRDREVKFIEHSLRHQEMMSKQFKATGQKIYPVIPSTPAEGFDDLQSFLRSDGRRFDVVIFDLPGTTNTQGVLTTIACLDHVFIPISSDALVMESTLLLVSILVESIIGKGDHTLRSANLFWTKVDKRERTIYYEKYNKIIKQFGLNRMQTEIPDRKMFNKEIDFEQPVPYRSTLFAPDKLFVRDGKLDEFTDELCAIIGLSNYGKKE
jgi:cellulose biosynthesis protein BcsQ